MLHTGPPTKKKNFKKSHFDCFNSFPPLSRNPKDKQGQEIFPK